MLIKSSHVFGLESGGWGRVGGGKVVEGAMNVYSQRLSPQENYADPCSNDP